MGVPGRACLLLPRVCRKLSQEIGNVGCGSVSVPQPTPCGRVQRDHESEHVPEAARLGDQVLGVVLVGGEDVRHAFDDADAALRLQALCRSAALKTEVLSGNEILTEMVAQDSIDTVVSGIVNNPSTLVRPD